MRAFTFNSSADQHHERKAKHIRFLAKTNRESMKYEQSRANTKTIKVYVCGEFQMIVFPERRVARTLVIDAIITGGKSKKENLSFGNLGHVF